MWHVEGIYIKPIMTSMIIQLNTSERLLRIEYFIELSFFLIV